MAELIIPGFNPIIPGLVYTGERKKETLEGLVLVIRKDPDQQMVLDAMKIVAASLPKNAVSTGETFENSYNPQRFLREILSRYCRHFREALVQEDPSLIEGLTQVLDLSGVPKTAEPCPMLYSFLGPFSIAELERAHKSKLGQPAYHISQIMKDSCVHAALRISNGALPERKEIEASIDDPTKVNPKNVLPLKKLVNLVYTSLLDKSKIELVRDDTLGNTYTFAFSTLINYANLNQAPSPKKRKKNLQINDGEDDEISLAV